MVRGLDDFIYHRSLKGSWLSNDCSEKKVCMHLTKLNFICIKDFLSACHHNTCMCMEREKLFRIVNSGIVEVIDMLLRKGIFRL